MTLTSVTDIVAEELEAWELAAIRDPRRWAAASRARWWPPQSAPGPGQRSSRCGYIRAAASAADHASDPLDYAEQTVRAVADEARRLLDR